MLQTKFGWKQASGYRGDVFWKCEQTPDGRRTDAGRRKDDGRRAITKAHPEHMLRWAKNKQNLKVLKSRRQYNLFFENYLAFKGLRPINELCLIWAYWYSRPEWEWGYSFQIVDNKLIAKILKHIHLKIVTNSDSKSAEKVSTVLHE